MTDRQAGGEARVYQLNLDEAGIILLHTIYSSFVLKHAGRTTEAEMLDLVAQAIIVKQGFSHTQGLYDQLERLVMATDAGRQYKEMFEGRDLPAPPPARDDLPELY